MMYYKVKSREGEWLTIKYELVKYCIVCPKILFSAHCLESNNIYKFFRAQTIFIQYKKKNPNISPLETPPLAIACPVSIHS